MRYFLELCYNGSGFAGWQVQQNALSVQQLLDEALQTLLGRGVVCTGSGRTDAGVHATMQVAHFDATLPFEEEMLVYKLNAILPKEVAVRVVRPVRPDAHARFDAVARTYHYHLHQQKDPFKEGFSYYFRHPLSLHSMNDAARLLLEWTDFQCFSKVHTDVTHFDCTVFEAAWKNQNDTLMFYVSANRFLRGMVRAMVGTMLEVGLGKLDLGGFRKILESRDRKAAARNVPPEGLYLANITYPNDVYIIQ